VVALHFVDCGAIQDHPVAIDGSNTRPMHGCEARGVIEGLNKEACPLRGWAPREPEGDSVEGTAGRSITTRRADFIHNDSGNPNRFEGSGRTGRSSRRRGRLRQSRRERTCSHRRCLGPSPQQRCAEVLITALGVGLTPKVEVILAGQPRGSGRLPSPGAKQRDELALVSVCEDRPRDDVSLVADSASAPIRALLIARRTDNEHVVAFPDRTLHELRQLIARHEMP